MKRCLVNLLFILLILSACSDRGPVCSGDDCHGTIVGLPNQDNYGSPNKIGIWGVPKDEIDITFSVIGDAHLNATSCKDSGDNASDKMNNNRKIVDDINIDCKNDGCTFVAFVGDVMNNASHKHNLQQVIAFRQLYENDYPGKAGGAIAGCGDSDYSAYSKGSWIRYPVFPSVGNHDVPPWNHDSDKDWNKFAEYINKRIEGAPGVLTQHGNSSYIWRQGSYYCIQLGLWAGSHEEDDWDKTDEAKLQWLKDFLASRVRDSGLGILLFQHYGWDGFSADPSGGWWKKEQRDKEINILCRRDSADQPCNPYNVIGIFSGHTHERADMTIDAGFDASGKPVTFNNYVITSTGSGDQPGYSMVYVRGSENKIIVRSKNIDKPAGQEWSTTEKALITMPERRPNSFRYLVGRKLGADGNVQSGWSSLAERPYRDSIPAGGGAASAAIDGDPRPDIVLMGIENFKQENKFYYQIGFNLSETSGGDIQASSWSPVIWGPPTGSWTTAGGGAAVADIDHNGRPDLIFMAVDDPEGENHFRYVVGWNLDAEGHAASWSGVKSCPVDIGVYSAGGGAAVAERGLSGNNSRPDLIFMAIDNPEGKNRFRYVVGWYIDANGDTPYRWSDVKTCPIDIGVNSAGGGLDIADIDGNGRPDLIFMAIDNPEGENRFRYVVGWNIDSSGNPIRWSESRECPTGIGHEDNGGGAIVTDLDGDGNPDLLFMGMDNPP